VSTLLLLPPGITAFSALPPRMPPQGPSISSCSRKPVSISNTPGLFTCPDTHHSRAPGSSLQPSPAYQAAPRFRMTGMFAMVSTLLMIVGQPNRPSTAGKGGLLRG